MAADGLIVRVAFTEVDAKVLKLVIGPLKNGVKLLLLGEHVILVLISTMEKLLGRNISTEPIAVHPAPAAFPPGTIFVLRKLLMLVVVVRIAGTSNDQL